MVNDLEPENHKFSFSMDLEPENKRYGGTGEHFCLICNWLRIVNWPQEGLMLGASPVLDVWF